MKIKAVMLFVILAMALLNAQESTASKQAPGVSEEAAKNFKQPYRFDYTLTELNGKQKINARKFEILTTRRGETHAGSRVPVPTGNSSMQFQYVDTGLTAEMNCRPAADGEIELHVQVNMSFFVSPEGASSTPSGGVITRNIKIEVDSQVKVGAPTLLGTIEDVASTHSYELSVTANPR